MKKLRNRVVALSGAVLIPLLIALVTFDILKMYGDVGWQVFLAFWLGPAMGNVVFFLSMLLLYKLTTGGEGKGG